jgi:hypothetical protein
MRHVEKTRRRSDYRRARRKHGILFLVAEALDLQRYSKQVHLMLAGARVVSPAIVAIVRSQNRSADDGFW